jgi:hypothetical protein
MVLQQHLVHVSLILHTTVIRSGFVYGSHGGFIADLFQSPKNQLLLTDDVIKVGVGYILMI